MRGAALAVLCCAVLASGCQAGGKSNADAVATVNGHPVLAGDLQREIDQRKRKDPTFVATPQAVREQIEVLVNRRLLIQEAQDRRLTEDARFTQTIRTFWEQTLVRLLLERFHEEIQAMTPVTEAEIREYHDRMGYKATFQILSRPTQAEAIETARLVREGGQADWEQTLGPARYDELRAEPLEEAFKLEPGGVKVFSHSDGRHWVVRLASKEAQAAPPLEEVREKVETLLRAKNERNAFDRWLGQKRAAAKVTLHPENFGKVS